jgi:hypothetical protein
MSAARKLRTADDNDRFRAAMIAPDEAFFASEQKWGVGRLERIISPSTLMAYQRGWSAYRQALESGDAAAVEAIGPKMIQALAVMDAEATAAGHKPLAPDTWEADMGNGVTLVVVRTNAEASAVLRASRAADGASYETTLPPDLAVTVRDLHEGRALVVITVAEIVRLLRAQETGLWGTKWEGTPAHSGRQADEMAAHDLVRSGYPMSEPLTVAQPSAVILDF